MKQWTEEDLILLFYDELSDAEAGELRSAMAASPELQEKYSVLQEMLGDERDYEIPPPAADLNQRIMAGVEELRVQQSGPEQTRTRSAAGSSGIAQKLKGWLGVPEWSGAAAMSMALVITMVAIFYAGRWSAENPGLELVVEQPADAVEAGFGADASRRILLSNVSSHMQSGQRLLSLVSNGGEDLGADIDARRQMIEDLLEFNRLYRRLAEQSNDAVLASVLQQMESVLLEINHTDVKDDGTQWKQLQQRLEDSDLQFKLKVTDKRIKQQII